MSSVFPKAWETTIGATIAGCSWIKGMLSVSFRTVQELQENPEEEVQPEVVMDVQESTTAASSTTTTAAAAATSTTLINLIISINKKINTAVSRISVAWLVKFTIPDKNWVFLQLVIYFVCFTFSIIQGIPQVGLRVLLVLLLCNLMLLGGQIVVIISSY